MLFNHRLLLSILLLLTTFGYKKVEARSHRWRRLRNRGATVEGVDIDGLNLLQSYVCPADSNSVKRQAISQSIATPVTVPASDLARLYQALKSIETQAAGSTQRRSEKVSLKIHGLDALMTYVCSNDSNKMRRRNSSTMIILVSIDDLAELYELVLVLLQQIVTLLNAQGISTATIGSDVVSSTAFVMASVITSFTSVEAVTVTITTTILGSGPLTITSQYNSTEFPIATTLTTELGSIKGTPVTWMVSPTSLYAVEETDSSTSLDLPPSSDSSIGFSISISAEAVKGTPLTWTISPTSSGVGKTDSFDSAACYQDFYYTVVETIVVGGSTVTIIQTETSASAITDFSDSSIAASPVPSPSRTTISAVNAQLVDAIRTSMNAAVASTVFPTVSTITINSDTSVSIPVSSAFVAASSTAGYSDLEVQSVVAFSTTDSPMSTSMDMSSTKSDVTESASAVFTISTETTATATATATANNTALFSQESAIVSITVPTAVVATTAGLRPSPSSSYGYTFKAQSTSNVVVYFGQTAATSAEPLLTMCKDPDIDVVVLSFVIARNYSGVYPQVNFGAACGAQTALMEVEAPGLLQCTQLADYIDTCQSLYGKKIMVSIGGATAQLSFIDETDAVEFGTVLWRLFGPPGQIDDDLRPFGNVTIDGFDIDNEDNLPAHFDTLGSTLRAAYATDTNKDYYLSSAPQCPYPDASNPLGLLVICDFVFVQFYNNPWCEIGSVGFNASFEQWSTILGTSTLPVPPRLYLGAPSFLAAGSTAYGYIGSPAGIESIAKETLDLGLSNFGGVMFWDGPEGVENLENGASIINYAKLGLTT